MVDGLLRIARDIRKRRSLQTVFKCPLRYREVPVQNLVDVSPNRTFRVRLLVEMEEAFVCIHAANGFIDVVQRDLVKPSAQLRTAASALRLNDPGFPQL